MHSKDIENSKANSESTGNVSHNRGWKGKATGKGGSKSETKGSCIIHR